jgi:hypothetical protein
MSNPTLVEIVNEWIQDRLTDSFIVNERERDAARATVRAALDALIEAGLLTEDDIDQEYLA